jgi:hypothetical protein
MFLFFVLASDRLIDRRNATLWEEMGYPTQRSACRQSDGSESSF